MSLARFDAKLLRRAALIRIKSTPMHFSGEDSMLSMQDHFVIGSFNETRDLRP